MVENVGKERVAAQLAPNGLPRNVLLRLNTMRARYYDRTTAPWFNGFKEREQLDSSKFHAWQAFNIYVPIKLVLMPIILREREIEGSDEKFSAEAVDH